MKFLHYIIFYFFNLFICSTDSVISHCITARRCRVLCICPTRPQHFIIDYRIYYTAEKLKNSQVEISDVIATLKAETQKLSEDIQNARRTGLRQINDLTAELDNLKKLRLGMEVEVERMKKLLM